jgi:MSHA pilin protein MshD
MSSRRASGFTLIEMVIAIVIISVGLAGVLLAFTTAVKSSADPLIHKQMLAIAEEMMEEVLLKPYAPGPGTISGCDRTNADDVSDYATYTNQPVCEVGGTPVTSLSTYTVTVTVDPTATLGGALSGSVKKVTVTVTHSGESLKLVGWRTDYAS